MAQPASMEHLTRSSVMDTEMHPQVTRLERQVARVSPIWFVGLAVSSMIISALIAILGTRKEFANFVGLWAPSFLLLGIYNRFVRLEETEGTITHMGSLPFQSGRVRR